MQKWCTTVGLRLNANKTTILLFTKRRKLKGLRPIQLRGELIDMKLEIKYLGLKLDSKLLWNKHAETYEIQKTVS